MPDEIFNPNRRYKAFRPRQAARGLKATGTPTNLATVCMFNNTTGAQYLVLRDLTVSGTVGDLIAVSYLSGQIGTVPGKVSQMLPSQGVQVGLLTSLDTATVFAGDYSIALGQFGFWEWEHEFPLAVLEPGWSVIFQDATAAHAIVVSAMWESITTEELDWSW
jgi:hypothetical protein